MGLVMINCFKGSILGLLLYSQLVCVAAFALATVRGLRRKASVAFAADFLLDVVFFS